MNRREFSGALALGGLALAMPRANAAPAVNEVGPFSGQTVVDLAQRLAEQSYAPPPVVADVVGSLTYDQYRDIRFRGEEALWHGENRGFIVDLLHAGSFYRHPVEVNIVEDGMAKQVVYSPHLFSYGPLVGEVPSEGQNLFSGVRVRAHINTPEYWDEVAVFQGASYFRAVGEGQLYGLSARGLAIDTAEPKGEEFPSFRVFWVERPELAAKTITIHALLDSPGATGAYRFRIIPGPSTLMEIDVTLFARRELKALGLAPLTSMFLFDATNGVRFDDFRPAVHDSDGVSIRRSNGEWIWRPLANPKTLQISAFADTDPSIFGLMQRSRQFQRFEDLEAHYEKRPSAWVEPKGDWGEGQVMLIEIPSDRETNDNIVAFWRPKEALRKGQRLQYGYWLHWGGSTGERRLAQVVATRSGLSFDQKRRLFVVDFAIPAFGGTELGGDVEPKVSASKGKISNVVGRRNPIIDGYRVSFELEPEGAELSELRLVLARGSETLSETWLYRWTRQ